MFRVTIVVVWPTLLHVFCFVGLYFGLIRIICGLVVNKRLVIHVVLIVGVSIAITGAVILMLVIFCILLLHVMCAVDAVLLHGLDLF